MVSAPVSVNMLLVLPESTHVAVSVQCVAVMGMPCALSPVGACTAQHLVTPLVTPCVLLLNIFKNLRWDGH